MNLTRFESNTQRPAAGYFICLRNVARTIALVWLASASISALAADGYVYDAAGQVSLTVGKNAPRLAAKYDTVASGMVIRTGDNSHAVLKFEDGQVVSMQGNSTFQIREYRYVPKHAEESSIAFAMIKGGMRFVTGQIGQLNPNAFRLITPHATIRIHGTEFLTVIANNATYSKVLSGSISMTNAAGMTIVSAGQSALASSATTLTSTIPAASVPDGTFNQIAAISLSAPAPAPAPLPKPTPIPAVAAASTGAPAAITTPAATAGATTAATSSTATTIGGAATGGATASTATVAATGISATTIGIGVGVAAIAAAVLGKETTTTTHH